jgi:transcriptional regulator with XRE-family HTH domain
VAKVHPVPKPAKPRHFIKEWRLHRGLTQERLAERVGVTHGALSQLERGLTNYTQPMVEALADALHCEIGDLITRDPNSDIWSIWDTVRKLPPEELRRVRIVLEAFQKAS